MTKIPVGETILYAYRFTFSHLGAIIGLIWVPMVLVTVAGFFVGQRYYTEASVALDQGNLAALGPSILMMLGYTALSLLLYAMMNVSVTELALGTRKPGQLAHFAFGRIEWRMLRAILAFIGVLLLPVAVILGITGIAHTALALGQGPGSLAAAALLIALEFAFLYAALRFVFLLAPVAVAEEGNVLERAWKLSAGNFWRILAVLAVSMGPVMLFTAGVQIVLLGPANFIPELNPTVAETAAQIYHTSVSMPLVTGIGFVVSPLTFGLMLGAATFAYRALTRAENSSFIPPP